MPEIPITGSTTWLVIAAIIVGGIVRALKTNALSAILTSLFRPEGPPIAIPTRALPFVALAFGSLGAFLDALVRGASWDAAAQAGVMAAAGAVFGHELLSGLPGAKKMVGVLVLIIPLSTATSSCAPAKTPREQARSVVLTVAEGVRIGDEACASIATAKEDLDLAVGCAAAVLEAREALLIAEDGIDAWNAASAEKLPCAVKASASALSRLLGAVERAGGKTPPAVTDALRLAPLLAGACRG